MSRGEGPSLRRFRCLLEDDDTSEDLHALAIRLRKKYSRVRVQPDLGILEDEVPLWRVHVQVSDLHLLPTHCSSNPAGSRSSHGPGQPL
jgi:hypothetical protein